MIYKILISLLLLINFSYASFKEVRIGNIDDYYADKISEYVLRLILDEIEYNFEATLNMDIFDYSDNGIDIDIVYVKPTKEENSILDESLELEEKKEEIDELKPYILEQDEELRALKADLSDRNKVLNARVKEFNEYVKDRNNRVSRTEYSERKADLNAQIDSLNDEKRDYQELVWSYNSEVLEYKELINEYNKKNKKLILKNKNFKKIKGATYASKKVTVKTFYKDGVIHDEKRVVETRNKIEIFGFNSLDELKVIIAHEIGHLVGLVHIDKKGALMNPIVQKSQINYLELTQEDIMNFEENFNK